MSLKVIEEVTNSLDGSMTYERIGLRLERYWPLIKEYIDTVEWLMSMDEDHEDFEVVEKRLMEARKKLNGE